MFMLCIKVLLALSLMASSVRGYGQEILLPAQDSRPFCYEDMCRCYKNQADCSISPHLHFVPKLPADITDIDLSFSGIGSIDSADFFTNVTGNGITSLNLDFNSLSYIAPGAFDKLHNLTHLSMENNNLRSLPANTFSAATLDRLQEVELSNNPFHCQCDLKWLAEWYVTKPHVFQKSFEEQYTCTDNLGNVVNIKEILKMDKQACLMKHETCVLIITLLTTFIAIFTFILVLMACGKRRITVPNFGITLTIRNALSTWQRMRLLNSSKYHYDLFVSFSEEDSDLVMNQLKPHLEDKLKLKLCIHHRDFHPGRNTLDNVQECVEKSRRFLMVFSSHFAASPWCQFELSLCQQLAMERRVELVVILAKAARRTHCQVTPSMRAIMKTHTYIPWRQDADSQVQFWQRLTAVFADVIMAQQLCERRQQRQQQQEGQELVQIAIVGRY
uniref:Toll-like recptor 6 n=1 Tax=Oncomelania hupensis TaxID=56141 RepID=A0A2H4HHZ9_9CAEN|nr:toll-like recptor 6 [Oncomelania hupensis]